MRLLLDACEPAAYVPVDISQAHLTEAARTIHADYEIAVYPTVADYSAPFELPEPVQDLRQVAFFPGSSIGNFDPAAADAFLEGVAEVVGPGGWLAVGVDMKKDPGVLHRAYNDAAGVTAAFNRNVLTHINATLGADFDPAAFAHEAVYNESAGRIEMYLVANTREHRSERRYRFAERTVLGKLYISTRRIVACARPAHGPHSVSQARIYCGNATARLLRSRPPSSRVRIASGPVLIPPPPVAESRMPQLLGGGRPSNSACCSIRLLHDSAHSAMSQQHRYGLAEQPKTRIPAASACALIVQAFEVAGKYSASSLLISPAHPPLEPGSCVSVR